MDSRLDVEEWPIGRVVPYDNNPRDNEAAVPLVADSLRQFGWRQPIVVDEDGVILAGHTRLQAAKLLEMEVVPVHVARGLSPAKARAYRIADNRTGAEAEFDLEKLAVELAALRLESAEEGEPTLDHFLGFSDAELRSILGEDGGDTRYNRNVESPVYEPTGEAPAVADLLDDERAVELISRIEAADIPDDVRAFLVRAAARHVRFNYASIAEFYCHAPAEIQRLMEDSALVIIDFDAAIESGYVQLSERLNEIYRESYDQ